MDEIPAGTSNGVGGRTCPLLLLFSLETTTNDDEETETGARNCAEEVLDLGRGEEPAVRRAQDLERAKNGDSDGGGDRDGGDDDGVDDVGNDDDDDDGREIRRRRQRKMKKARLLRTKKNIAPTTAPMIAPVLRACFFSAAIALECDAAAADASVVVDTVPRPEV